MAPKKRMKLSIFLKYFSPFEIKTSFPRQVPRNPTNIIAITKGKYSSKEKPTKKKVESAKALKIKIINQDEFLKMLNKIS